MKIPPNFLHPYIGEDNREIRLEVRSKHGSMIRFYLQNTTKIKRTQVHSKSRHTTLYLFQSHVKRKTEKCFNEGITFNAHVTHYSLATPKRCMSIKAHTTIPERQPRLLKILPWHLESLAILGGNCSVPPKGPIR